jgi:hypothetical protein
MTTRRIQRSRARGWRAPAGALYVGRGTRWGNPYQVARRGPTLAVLSPTGGIVHGHPVDAADARRIAVQWYRAWLSSPHHTGLREAVREELAGRDLMCWCPLPGPGQPDHCHAAVLLHLAAGGEL